MDAFPGHSEALVRAPEGIPAPVLFDWWCKLSAGCGHGGAMGGERMAK